MTHITGLTPEAEIEFLKWVTENKKTLGSLTNPQAWTDDLLNELTFDSDRRNYEICSFESASGNPEIFRFTDNMLIYSNDQS